VEKNMVNVGDVALNWRSKYVSPSIIVHIEELLDRHSPKKAA
jgi:hypothetical protein